VSESTDVPFNDLRRLPDEVRAALVAVATDVVNRGWYLLGPETESFEVEFAASCSAPHAVAVANGTDALEIALRALGCQSGDEVVVTANAGMYATTACLAIGACPVFAEIDPGTLLIDPKSVASLVTDRTIAVVATHLYGNVVDVGGLRAQLPTSIAVVEDAAQAHGATFAGEPVGSLGDVAAFSFYPTKNLGALGDAGAVVTARPDVAERARALRQYGWESRYRSTVAGGRNSRIDEIQAAWLRVLLPLLPDRNSRRLGVQARYVDALGDRLDFVGRETGLSQPVAHLCVARSAARDRLLEDLAGAGVAAAVHYPVPDHHQPALQGVPYRHDDLRESERACREVISLPCFPELRDDEVASVIRAVERFA
jgi:dTDP-4-amino-4,6-dideoxygalactose transaminase